jgi:hypothetical protein
VAATTPLELEAVSQPIQQNAGTRPAAFFKKVIIVLMRVGFTKAGRALQQPRPAL